MTIITFVRRFSLICAIGALAILLLPDSIFAQTSGYAVGESAAAPAGTPASQTAVASDNAAAGPVRMARFSYVQGDVSWRADEELPFSTASNNQPMKQGAQISVGGGGRAEIQFDDGSYLRLGNGAMVTIQLLFSDAQGEFTQLKLTNGLASLRLKQNGSVYQVDTPLVSVKADGPARMRIGISDGVEVGLREGAAVVEGAKGKVTVHGGDYLDLRNEASPYDLHDLPPADSWETWVDDRDQMLDAAEQSLEKHEVPPDVALVAGNLDAYGTWRTDAVYGQVWCPRTIDASWRPYYAGHWVWVSPFGWTWCSDEAWGWAPYHYGAWFHAIYGWAWRPGPAHQYWSPAVVHFTESNGNIAWCALAPGEIQYPAAISVGAYGSDWPAHFSIGAAGCYYPVGTEFCVGRPFSTVVANRSAARPPVGTAVIALNGNTVSAGRQFVPVNARAAAGATVSSQAAFVGRGPYTPMIAGSTIVFVQGRTASAPTKGAAAAFGPLAVMPTASMLTPLRSASAVTSYVDVTGIALRPVFHSAVPKEPVKTGIAATPIGSGIIRVGGGNLGSSTSGATSGSTGRTYGTVSEAVAAARAALNGGGRNPSGSSSTAGSSTSGSSNSSGGYTGGHTSGGAPATGTPPSAPNPSSSTGHTSGGGSPPSAPSPPSSTGRTSGGGSPPSAPSPPSSTGHTSGGSPAGGGYHVGGGSPPAGGGAPARR